ncbi:MAG: hypothetical protein ACREQ3_01260 [Candidatus Binatia bacterium]
MFRDPLVQKAWELREQAECFPLEVILKATLWLEEKYQQTPEAETAIAIALQYMVLAMRRAQANPARAKEYFSQALHWRDEARTCFTNMSEDEWH